MDVMVSSCSGKWFKVGFSASKSFGHVGKTT